MKKYGLSVFISMVFTILVVTSAHAGGMWLYEQAISDMGVGGAGRQAAGLDASTASGNPAAMTRLDQSQVAGGILGIYPDIQFDVQNSTFGGGDGGNAGNFTPVPTLYYVHSLSSDLKLGLGVAPISVWASTTAMTGPAGTTFNAPAMRRRQSTPPSPIGSLRGYQWAVAPTSSEVK